MKSPGRALQEAGDTREAVVPVVGPLLGFCRTETLPGSTPWPCVAGHVGCYLCD